MRKALWVAAALLGSAGTAALANPSVFPTGTTRYDPAKAWNGYVIFSGTDEKTHLIDMNGNEVRTWDHQGFPGELLDPAVTGGAKGHVLVQLAASDQNGIGTVPGMKIFSNKSIAELDWNGKVTWQWNGEGTPPGEARQHHDWQRLANGNTLVLANWPHKVDGFTLPQQLDDAVYEVTPAGKVAWRWAVSEHLDELGFTAEQLKLIREASTPDYFHLNDMTSVGPNKWFDGGDKRFAPDNVLIDSRNGDFVAIIDRKSGKVVWHLGPNLPPLVSHAAGARPAPAPQPGQPVDQFVGQHDAHIIPKGLPGAGDLLLFDNQGAAGYPDAELATVGGSRVLEIDPTTGKVVWSYTADNSDQPLWAFRSAFISSARRLPNGNTLIDEGMNGRFFQVTPAGEIVWEYVSPYFAKTSAAGSGRPVTSNWVYRAQPVPYDWTPEGTPHEETAVVPPTPANFHIKAGA
ncbi:arylsulfotransferase ASST [Novosphingobium sp. PhB165]|uniref:arylsulfotransferase family protein n=1 Tax=Novosphingobium sp. PhB165 TaxID=2485105 RepID=UPI001044F888|nr:aryl-sulfate sulfotransferase [Novosphingobium sp. PhB165]TCM15763.1 arylsulfotransferase ASST [Novosphingobium sp. PhB165]